MAGNNWSGCPLRHSRGIVIQDLVSDIIVSQRISAWLGQLRFPSWLTVQGSLIENLVAEFFLFFFKEQMCTEPTCTVHQECRMPSHPRLFLLTPSDVVCRQRRSTVFFCFRIHRYSTLPYLLACVNRRTCPGRSGASRPS